MIVILLENRAQMASLRRLAPIPVDDQAIKHNVKDVAIARFSLLCPWCSRLVIILFLSRLVP